MRLLEHVSVQRVLEAFRDDQKVRALGEPWPNTRDEQAAVLRRAERPADYIVRLRWGLYALDRDEFLAEVRPIWVPPGQPPYCWTLGQMLAAVQAGTFKPPEPNRVSELVTAMGTRFRETEFVLVGYRDLARGILLEEGHNRVTAAYLAGVIPATVKMFVSER